METWYKVKNENEVDSPALLVYPDRIRHNIALAVSMIDDVKRLRPHVKTHKNKEILQLQLDAGITKFKCATLAEAIMLGECGALDVLFSFPLLGPRIDKFLDLVADFPNTKFSAIVDCADSALALAEAVQQKGMQLDVFLDLDLGMGRTGMHPGEQALALYRMVVQMQSLQLQGFHAYDGHVREVDLQKRAMICHENFAPISEMIQILESENIPRPHIIIGGSPSFPIYAKYQDVDCSPGTFVLWDQGYGEGLPEQAFLPAAVLLCRVISLPGKNRICVDLGYKAVASENPLDQRFRFLNGQDLRPISQSEEHLVLEKSDEQSWQIGDVLYALPYHVCPTVALYNTLKVVEEGCQTNIWSVSSRNRS